MLQLGQQLEQEQIWNMLFWCPFGLYPEWWRAWAMLFQQPIKINHLLRFHDSAYFTKRPGDFYTFANDF